jgi:hypothetical protein
VTLHTLRHSFATVANDLGLSEPTIAAMLGHSRGTVTSRYVHHIDATLLAATDRVAAVIADALAGITPAAVVSMTDRRPQNRTASRADVNGGQYATRLARGER